MSMIDPFAPLRYRQDFNKLGLDYNKFYYIAFFKGFELDTRPIKIKDVFVVHSSSAGSKYLRTEAYTEYHFETEKTVMKKIIDPRWWVRLFSKPSLIEEKITDKWKINFDEEWNTIDLDLIADTPELAKLKLIMIAQQTPYPSEHKITIINKEMEYYQEYHPDLVLKAMGFSFDTQYGDITDYGKMFLNIKGDLRNGNNI